MQAPDPVDIHSESFLHSLMRKQLRLSILCACAFLLGLVGLPLANYFLPDLMSVRIFGFTLTWLILGVGFFPVVWLIAWVFIRQSMALEDEEVRKVEETRAVPDMVSKS
jgi:uncharacterized membrane protein (DUF485 family)